MWRYIVNNNINSSINNNISNDINNNNQLHFAEEGIDSVAIINGHGYKNKLNHII